MENWLATTYERNLINVVSIIYTAYVCKYLLVLQVAFKIHNAYIKLPSFFLTGKMCVLVH